MARSRPRRGLAAAAVMLAALPSTFPRGNDLVTDLVTPGVYTFYGNIHRSYGMTGRSP